MSRSNPEVSRTAESNRAGRKLASVSAIAAPPASRNHWIFRFLLIACCTLLGYALVPFNVHVWTGAVLGAAVAIFVLLTESLLRVASTVSLVGGSTGALAGALFSVLISQIIFRTSLNEPGKSFLSCTAALAFVYLGATLGARRAHLLRLDSLPGIMRVNGAASHSEPKLLDTSVLIDGRVADICEAHFLDGPLLVPQFVLHELQTIADSADSLRRQRGRRGLDVLDRIRKMAHVQVRVIDDNTRSSGEVDHKLIELAQRLGAKIVTNDFNLNKVASVQGISVLNINLLANALRPAVLPGEPMRVFILREGKEVNQGVAYLEDGTMVVVDGARRLINKTVDILVTSVHQTPAGKMIFGRVDDRADTPAPGVRQAAVGRGPRPAIPENDE